MTDPARCSSCGLPLDQPGPDGLCPACLMKLGALDFARADDATRLEPTGEGATRLGPVTDAFGTAATRLDSGAAVRRTPVPTRLSGAPDPPGYIGPYRILETLGEGGMGIVYLCEQTEPLRRKVAVKVIKIGMDTRDIVARFDAERQALALMDHPNIAHVYDAGATGDGRPYFVMEHVVGSAMTEFCDVRRLSTKARLQLFVDVCGAIQHAHQKGVIHRDLKPSNVLVAEQDGRFVPKVIDFGIAKAVERSSTDRTMFTEHGVMVGTPEYMSPEQAALSPDIDTTTDVYSLGVLLYELLVGALPFDPKALRAAGYDEMRRVIRESDPPKPSTRLTALGVQASTVAGTRQTDVGPLTRQLTGDLDWITLKALEKDRTRRYPTAAAFAQDVERYLANEPVQARPPSTAYRIRKFTRRYRGAVSAAAALLVVLLAGLTTSTVQYFRAERERVEADRQRATADTQRTTAEAATINERAARQAEAQQRQAAEAARGAAQTSLATAETNLYFNNVDLADRELLANNITHVDQLLDTAPARLRGWEWNYLSRMAHMEAMAIPTGSAIGALMFSADGRRLITANLDMTVREWDAGTLRPIGPTRRIGTEARPTRATRLDFGPDGRALVSTAMVSEGGSPRDALTPAESIDVWEIATGRRQLHFTSNPFGLAYSAFALGPDGARFMITSGDLAAIILRGGRAAAPITPASRLGIWDLRTSQELSLSGAETASSREFVVPIEELAFSHDGTQLASATRTEVSLLDPGTRQSRMKLDRSEGASRLTFSHRGEFLAAVRQATTILLDTSLSTSSLGLWSVADGSMRWSGPVDARVTCVAFSPDDRWLAVGRTDFTVRILDVATGQERRRLTGHTALISALTFAADGARLVSGGDDGSLRVWNVLPSLGPIQLPVGDSNQIVALSTWAFPRAAAIFGQALLRNPSSTNTQPTIAQHWWNTRTGTERAIEWQPSSPAVSVSGNGTRLVMSQPAPSGATSPADMDVVDTQTGQVTATVQPAAGIVARPGQRVRLVSAVLNTTGDRLAAVISGQSLSPASGMLLGPAHLAVWDLRTAKRLVVLSFSNRVVTGPEFSPDGRLIAAFVDGMEGVEVHVYDASKGRQLLKIPGAVKPVFAFSPDSGSVAVVTAGFSVVVRDIATGAEHVRLPRQNLGAMPALALNPDGTRIVTVSADGTVKLWDADSGRQLVVLRESSGPCVIREWTIPSDQTSARGGNSHSVAFGDDGQTIVLTTKGRNPKGWFVRSTTWNGAPRPAR